MQLSSLLFILLLLLLLWYWVLSSGPLHWATAPSLFFYFYFETGLCSVADLPRLGLDLQFSYMVSLEAELTSTCRFCFKNVGRDMKCSQLSLFKVIMSHKFTVNRGLENTKMLVPERRYKIRLLWASGPMFIKLLTQMCFCLKTPYLVHITDSLLSNLWPTVLVIKHIHFPKKAFHSLSCLETLRSTTLLCLETSLNWNKAQKCQKHITK